MPRCRRGPWWWIVLAVVLLFGWSAVPSEHVLAAPLSPSSGTLEILGKDGSVRGVCPLKHTDVHGAISGFLARVSVTQIFENSLSTAIEAIYTFPLPQDASVDDMTIQVGGRTIRALIKERREARRIYEKAKNTGHVAALLGQERPNIFSQAISNIMPGEQVTVSISYAETLQYQDGSYEFFFPMVVGPRYIPGQPTGKQGTGWAPDTDKVPDASKITPPVTPPGTRAGHDVSLELAIDAGVPIQEVKSSSHQIDVERPSSSRVDIRLSNKTQIPNKDFVLKYAVAGQDIGDAVLSQWSTGKSATGGHFTLILQPPARVPESDVTPKELVFVLDTSGSMMGFPITKAASLIDRALDELYPGDTFNLITFSGDTRVVFPEPVFPTAENIRKAREVLRQQRGYGGTEMMKAIRAALEPSDSLDHVRVVCFVTDGFVGNDLEIIGEIQKHPNARVFAFGIGSSVNRFLIEGMAKAGRGDSEVVTLNDKADEASHRLYERLRSPLLTDIAIDWHGLPVTDVYPQKLPDLFSGKPLVVSGRYLAPVSGNIRLKGKRAGEEFVREIPVTLTASAAANSILPGFWARRRIDDLMSRDWSGAQSGAMKPELQKEITQLGLDYRLMTQFTSFVAVEDRVVTQNGKPQRVEVPVELPEGVSYEGVFDQQFDRLQSFAKISAPPSFGASLGGLFHGSAKMAAPSAAVLVPAPPPPPSEGKMALPSSLGPPRSPERQLLESKLDLTLLAAYDCVVKKEGECKFVNDGQIRVQLWISSDTPAVREALLKAGFQRANAITRGNGFIGTIAVEKLPLLAQLPELKFASPSKR